MSAFLLAVIVALLAAVGYFVKRILDKTEAIGNDVADMKPKVDILWKDKYAPAQSPRKLNGQGESILYESGMKDIIEQNKQKLLDAVRTLKPTNAYDAEQAISSVVNDLPKHCPEVIPRLKDGAFKTGQSINVLLLVGGIYLRDMIFPDVGFSSTDLDGSPRNP